MDASNNSTMNLSVRAGASLNGIVRVVTFDYNPAYKLMKAAFDDNLCVACG
jgi:hypothetical protein